MVAIRKLGCFPLVVPVQPRLKNSASSTFFFLLLNGRLPIFPCGIIPAYSINSSPLPTFSFFPSKLWGALELSRSAWTSATLRFPVVPTPHALPFLSVISAQPRDVLRRAGELSLLGFSVTSIADFRIAETGTSRYPYRLG